LQCMKTRRSCTRRRDSRVSILLCLCMRVPYVCTLSV